ncbi:MAG: hypothetical protein AUG49_22930 [Catenulispora sp. 13_1_20CM_3_70_7]|jgi:hypothetical protein|nr:MAG: hypothetical protein AUG49_22930 [Catenulispora sp. 13_1_20CM_3_70_7]
MTQDTDTPGGTRGRRLVLAGAAAALALGAASSAGANTGSRAIPSYWPGSVVGSWYAQVHFPGQPFPGKTEETLITLTPGGGVVEDNAINPSPGANSGYWHANTDGTYTLRLLNFTYDNATSGMKQILDVTLNFVLDDGTHWHSKSASAVVYFFDPVSGKQVTSPIAVPNVTVTTAERFNSWQVPAQFPAQP